MLHPHNPRRNGWAGVPGSKQMRHALPALSVLPALPVLFAGDTGAEEAAGEVGEEVPGEATEGGSSAEDMVSTVSIPPPTRSPCTCFPFVA